MKSFLVDMLSEAFEQLRHFSDSLVKVELAVGRVSSHDSSEIERSYQTLRDRIIASVETSRVFAESTVESYLSHQRHARKGLVGRVRNHLRSSRIKRLEGHNSPEVMMRIRPLAEIREFSLLELGELLDYARCFFYPGDPEPDPILRCLGLHGSHVLFDLLLVNKIRGISILPLYGDSEAFLLQWQRTTSC